MPADHDPTAARFRRVAAAFTELVAGTDPGAWDRPAPCEGWVARDVVRHVTEWVPAVIGRSGVAFPPAPSADDDPATAWVALATTLQAALDDPAVASRTFDAGPPGTLSVEQAIGLLVVGDVLVHTWDLAVATGRSVALDPAVAEEMLVGMEAIDELLRSSGHYGPRVPVAADASLTDRLVGFTGRDPRWRG